MFGKIRFKIASSISKVEPPRNEKITHYFFPITTLPITQPLQPSLIGFINPIFNSTEISNNILLSFIVLKNDFYLVVEKEFDSFNCTSKFQDDSEKEIIINFPKTLDLFEEIYSEISIDLSLSKPKVIELDTEIISFITSFDKNYFIFDPIANFDLPISLFSYQPVNSIEVDFFFTDIITRNVFQPLDDTRNGGRNYEKKYEQPKDLFGDVIPEGLNFENGSRKSYKVISKDARSTHVNMTDFWDLLFPLLLPPLNFLFKEHLDLYKPLYPFQQQGVEFLFTHNSALLADEMGTGKTVQTIIALRLLYRKALIKNTLVICPLSILGSTQLSLKTGKSEGWDGHFFHWAPELAVTVVRGSDKQRKMDWKYPAHVFITTYDVIRNDIESGLLDKNTNKFDCIIVDEAQNIKNRESGRSKAVKKLSTDYRWALTGTPIENKVEDVISIFDFIKPKLFTKEDYSPQSVKRIIGPFFLRRLKRDVLKELPEKVRQEEWLELDEEQRIAYDEVLIQGRRKITSSLQLDKEFTIRTHIFTLIMELKKICNFAPNKETSPKTELLLEYLETIIENNAKVLIFSQYTTFGIDILEKLLTRKNIKYVTIKGDTPLQQRNKAVEDFRNSTLNIPIFLGSVKTAGLGISLTEASYVIHFDHWWNPASMWQAEDRAHRPGQLNKLNIYSFWMSSTIEERIKEKLHEKGLLIENVIDSLATNVIDEMISTEEWLDMLGITHTGKRFDKGSAKTLENILEEIKKMDPSDFEIMTKNFFVKFGYTNARVTQRSRDGGIDVFGSRKVDGNEETIVAQCKRTENVGINVARELLGVMASNQRIIKGFIVTSGVFSDDCQRFANANPKINLINGATYAKYLKDLKLL